MDLNSKYQYIQWRLKNVANEENLYVTMVDGDESLIRVDVHALKYLYAVGDESGFYQYTKRIGRDLDFYFLECQAKCTLTSMSCGSSLVSVIFVLYFLYIMNDLQMNLYFYTKMD